MRGGIFADFWWTFTNFSPHMRKVYGDSLRKEAGLTKTMRNVAMKNAKLLKFGKVSETPYGKAAQEFGGTVGKVYVDTVGVVNDFLAECEGLARGEAFSLSH